MSICPSVAALEPKDRAQPGSLVPARSTSLLPNPAAHKEPGQHLGAYGPGEAAAKETAMLPPLGGYLMDFMTSGENFKLFLQGAWTIAGTRGAGSLNQAEVSIPPHPAAKLLLG